MTMQLEYDLNVAALYIRLSGEPVAQTDEAGDDAAVDLDAAGRVVGIEILSAAGQRALPGILASYDIEAADAEQIKAYFKTEAGTNGAEQRLLIPVAKATPAPPLAVGEPAAA